MQLSEHARTLLLSARRSAPGAVLFRTGPPAAYRELRDNGLINTHVALTRRGAAEHARLTAQEGHHA